MTMLDRLASRLSRFALACAVAASAGVTAGCGGEKAGAEKGGAEKGGTAHTPEAAVPPAPEKAGEEREGEAHGEEHAEGRETHDQKR